MNMPTITNDDLLGNKNARARRVKALSVERVPHRSGRGRVGVHGVRDSRSLSGRRVRLLERHRAALVGLRSVAHGNDSIGVAL